MITCSTSNLRYSRYHGVKCGVVVTVTRATAWSQRQPEAESLSLGTQYLLFIPEYRDYDRAFFLSQVLPRSAAA
jgi:hypothetical protein